MKINAILSLECQAGKTTAALKEIVETHKEVDNIYLTFPLTHIRDEAIQKFEELAPKNLNIPVISTKKGAEKVYQQRLKGNIFPIVIIGMANITMLKGVKLLLSSTKTNKFKQHVWWDEIHKSLFGENITTDKEYAQVDRWLDALVKNKQCDELSCITATGQDLLLNRLKYDSVKILEGYDGFKGIRNAEWKILPEFVFKDMKEEYKNYKKGNPLPLYEPYEEIQDIMDMYGENDLIVNMDRQIGFHNWFQTFYPEVNPYNSEQKDASKSIVGSGSLGCSLSVRHNKILGYWDVDSQSTTAANIVQALGRVNGKKKPVIITTQRIQDLVLEYFCYMDKAIEEKVFHRSPEERSLWSSQQYLRFAKNLPGAKTRDFREITQERNPVEGTPEDTNEVFKDFYMPDLYDKKWEGKEPGREVRKLVKERDPDFYETYVSGKTYVTDTETREDGKLVVKHRTRAHVRIAKMQTKPGYIGLACKNPDITQIGHTVFDLSNYFYDTEGKVISLETVQTGTVSAKNTEK